ncbi:MAG: phage minor capsid protein [Oscillospiraceae bacterium]|nr:phage minor capsid protein [Oscillospiraceae bacterium]MDD7278265.1 phage minor capsid protein [Oscillospiraceae bacterium]
MLTPEYMQGAPAELEALFLRLEEEVIRDICRRIAKAGMLTESAEHQMQRLKELGAGTDYIKQKISEYSELSNEEVDRLFFDAAQTSDEFYKKAYAQANKEYTPYEYNDYFQQAVTAAVNQTKGELRNLTRSMGFSYRGSNGQVRFHTAAETYRDCLDYAFMQTATGMTDYNTAVRNATRRLTESGLQFVDYASGVRNHADVAARRAVLTGLSQYTGKISERNAEELDTDIVEVTAHAGARPDHAEWQGRWYSLSGKSKKYPSLVEVTGYGTGAGLKGWNCRHDFYPVIDGISEPSYTEEELQNIDPPPFEYEGKTYTYYEATQRQRYMERSMRKTKREILAADATGDKDRFTEKSVLLRRQREEYGKLSKAAGLLTQNQRTQVDGFGHSQAGKAVWAEKKALNQKYQQRMHNLGINNPPKSLDKFNEMKYNNTPEYQVMSKYISSVESGMLSPLAGFDKYKEYYENIENNVIGKTTSNGIVITGQTQHFLERIFGTKSDPNHNGMPRSGVALDDAIDALLNGKERPIKEEMLPDGTKRRSQILYSKKCSVSINPDTGIIIQCQPT